MPTGMLNPGPTTRPSLATKPLSTQRERRVVPRRLRSSRRAVPEFRYRALGMPWLSSQVAGPQAGVASCDRSAAKHGRRRRLHRYRAERRVRRGRFEGVAPDLRSSKRQCRSARGERSRLSRRGMRGRRGKKAARRPSNRTRRRCICWLSPCSPGRAPDWSHPKTRSARDETHDPRRRPGGDGLLAPVKALHCDGPARTTPCCRRRTPGRESRCRAGTSIRIARHESCRRV